MVSVYDEEAIAVPLFKKDVDPGTSFLAVTYHSRTAAVVFSSSRSWREARTWQCAVAPFSSTAFDNDDQGVELLLEDLDIDDRKGYDNP
jgi:hypothetical protein